MATLFGARDRLSKLLRQNQERRRLEQQQLARQAMQLASTPQQAGLNAVGATFGAGLGQSLAEGLFGESDALKQARLELERESQVKSKLANLDYNDPAQLASVSNELLNIPGFEQQAMLFGQRAAEVSAEQAKATRLQQKNVFDLAKGIYGDGTILPWSEALSQAYATYGVTPPATTTTAGIGTVPPKPGAAQQGTEQPAQADTAAEGMPVQEEAQKEQGNTIIGNVQGVLAGTPVENTETTQAIPLEDAPSATLVRDRVGLNRSPYAETDVLGTIARSAPVITSGLKALGNQFADSAKAYGWLASAPFRAIREGHQKIMAKKGAKARNKLIADFKNGKVTPESAQAVLDNVQDDKITVSDIEAANNFLDLYESSIQQSGQ